MRLNRDLRYQIKALLEAGLLQKDIAKQLGITPGGLCRELQRNGGRDKYDPDSADKRACRLARKAHVHYKYSDDIWAVTEAMIKDDLSPEQVVGRRGLEGTESPSVPTIYRHIRNVSELRPHLRHGRKPYRKRGAAKDRRGTIVGRVPIMLRPAEVDLKNRFGDIEIDLINGADHIGNIFTANDRQSNFCILEPLATKDAEELANTMIAAFMPYKELLHTVTSDNGKEFAGHARIASELGVGYYFAKPYHSWERGANENMNGLIRQYLPKGTSFEELTREQVKWIEWKLNNRPRKRLGFLTPLEYISRQVKQIYLTT